MSKEKSNQDEEKLSQQELLWKIYKNTEKMCRYILWKRIFSWAKVVVIVLIIIIGITYLPPLIEKTIRPYQELLQSAGQMSGQGQDIFEQLKKGGLDVNQLLRMNK